MSQPLSEGIARGATAGVATTATPVPDGFQINGRKVFASLAGRRARLQLHLPRRGRGGPALPLGALRQPRRADRGRLGHARHARHRLAHADLQGRLRRRRRRAAADRALRSDGGALPARLPDAHAHLHRAHARGRRLRAGLPRQHAAARHPGAARRARQAVGLGARSRSPTSAAARSGSAPSPSPGSTRRRISCAAPGPRPTPRWRPRRRSPRSRSAPAAAAR